MNVGVRIMGLRSSEGYVAERGVLRAGEGCGFSAAVIAMTVCFASFGLSEDTIAELHSQVEAEKRKRTWVIAGREEDQGTDVAGN